MIMADEKQLTVIRPERSLYEELKNEPGVVIVGGDTAPTNALTATLSGF